jgi:hypothetical protein
LGSSIGGANSGLAGTSRVRPRISAYRPSSRRCSTAGRNGAVVGRPSVVAVAMRP